jgi:hypothetical protein
MQRTVGEVYRKHAALYYLKLLEHVLHCTQGQNWPYFLMHLLVGLHDVCTHVTTSIK